ncbi:MAG: Crp/Fnr family transcriptional regulator, partial [Bacteroidota bacterium]
LFSKKVSHEHLEVLENSTVVKISISSLEELYPKYPKLESWMRLVLEEQITFLDNFYKGFLFMQAKEKYDLLIGTFPDILQRVNLGHIASLLGISQETLSRIRKKI